MEITWDGKQCFRVKGKGATVITNPYKVGTKLQGDIVLFSSDNHEDLELDKNTKMFDWPGEYEVKGVPITAFQAWTKSKSKEESEGQKGDSTLIFTFDMEGIKMCHLGNLGHILSSDMVKEIGDIDVLFINVGEGSNLDGKKALEVIEAIDPRAVIPMGSEDPKTSLKELGADIVEERDELSVKSKTELPDDKRLYILLKKN